MFSETMKYLPHHRLSGPKSASFVRCINFFRGFISHSVLIAFGASVFLSNSVVAQGFEQESPYEARPSLMWLSDDVSVAAFDDTSYESFLGKGEVWGKNWGVSAKLLQNDNNDVFGLPEDSEYFNLDVKRRFGNRDKSNFELGLGWQELNIESQLEASGPKVSLAGRLNLFRSFQVYGLTSYFPELEDNIADNDATAYEIEAGLLYKPLPSLSLKAGYRVFNLDLEDPEIKELGSSTGFLLGTDLSW